MRPRPDPARVVAVNVRFAIVALLVASTCVSRWVALLGALALVALLVVDREDREGDE
ncbi:MAG: hypothetical protein MUE69_15950 [Myxococcota bacterium]|nr:hypothetical protein [Myxococcota bacterium]